MKSKLFFCILFAFLFANTSKAQSNYPDLSPLTTVKQTVGLTDVEIKYSRPRAKGRTIFGNLVPYNKLWRTGANATTTIKFESDMIINNKKVTAGSYGLFTIPNQKEWTIILTKEKNDWGAYTGKPETDALRVSVKTSKVPFTEDFTIEFVNMTLESSEIRLKWENTAVSFNVEDDLDPKVEAHILKSTSDPNADAIAFYSAASYYLIAKKPKDLNKALTWISKGIEKLPEHWLFVKRAEIASKLGKCDMAIADAKTTIEKAEKAGVTGTIPLAKKILKDCGSK